MRTTRAESLRRLMTAHRAATEAARAWSDGGDDESLRAVMARELRTRGESLAWQVFVDAHDDGIASWPR